MSGHSKWATTKHRKAAQDAKRSALFSKLSRNITVAAKEGGDPNPDNNASLAAAIEKAKGYSMPKDKIDAARKAYDGLTEDQKKLVPDSVLKTLTDAEAAYAKLTKPGTKPGKPSTSTDTKKDDGKTVKSGQTGDAGIVLYAAMGLLSLTGGALVLGKKKKQD